MADEKREPGTAVHASWDRLEAARTRFADLNGRRERAMNQLRDSLAQLRALRATPPGRPSPRPLARPAHAAPDAQALYNRFRLTRREAQVAALLAEGRSNAAVAAALSLSPHTARHHTESILVKLRAHSRAEVGAILRRLT